jgi:hypothetical protein
MSFEEIQFPTDISYGATGGPMFLRSTPWSWD